MTSGKAAARAPVAIIGAGMSGLICARSLRSAGHAVTLFDKARGPGGRMATRRVAASGNAAAAQFDHGAQYFTARDERFAQEVASWREAGLVSSWHGRLVALEAEGAREVRNEGERHVGTPRMSALTRHLATGARLELGRRISSLEAADGARGWQLVDEAGESAGRFSAVVVAVPSAQAVPLLERAAPQLAQSAAEVRYAPCWAAMLCFEERLEVEYDGAFVNADATFSWVARDTSKPQRPDGDRWVLHASTGWSRAHLEQDRHETLPQLLAAFGQLVGEELPPIKVAMAHRWRFAQPENPLAERCLWSSEARIGACGDWCDGPRVEGAYLSGLAMAEAVLAGR